MHASIWKFRGDPDDLTARYESMLAEIPTANMALQLCLRATDGILLVDTCPTREAFHAFAASPEFKALRARHGMPEPESVEDHPVAAAFVDGRRRQAPGAPGECYCKDQRWSASQPKPSAIATLAAPANRRPAFAP